MKRNKVTSACAKVFINLSLPDKNLQDGRTNSQSSNSSLKIDTVLVEDTGLYELESRPSLLRYLRQLWNRRYFIIAQSRASALSTGRDRYLGNLWLILDPLFQVLIYALIFGLILKVDRGMDNFVGFLIIGVVFFGFLSKGITNGTSLIKGNKALISAFNFPCASLAFSSVLKQVYNNLTPAILAVIGAICTQWDQPLHWTILFVVPLFIMVHIFNLGATFLIGRITAFIPDAASIVTLGTRGLFFVSGIFFTIERFDASPVLTFIVEANPIYQFLMAFRDCVLNGTIPSSGVWAYLTLWSFALALVGFIFFWQAEERYPSVR